MASTYLTQSGTAGGSTTKFTKSFWIKRSGLGTQNYIFDNSGTAEVLCQFKSDDKFNFGIYDSGAYSTELISTQVFRDCSGWYNFVIAVDYTSGTQAHRARVYVNGTEITAWDTETRPSDATTTFDTWNSSKTLYIGSTSSGTNDFNGIMSYVIHVDGTAYAPTVFGSTDATTGEWKINTSPSITYGTKGFLILKNGNTITDQSSNSNDWTLGAGTLTATEDCPSDVFCTLNPNYQSTFTSSRAVMANGNTKWTGTSVSSSQNGILSTIGASKGKFYLEAKWVGTADAVIGVAKDDFGMMTAGTGGLQSAGWYGMNTNLSATGGAGIAWWSNNSATGDRGSTISSSDIIMMAIDIDNNKLYFGKNGTWEESGDPTSGATGTGATSTLASDTTYLVACANYGYATANSFEFNFGNGYFGTTIISSEGTNASGIGKFEYDVPAGYTAISAKGLQE